MTTIIPAEGIEKRIMLIRGQRVMIDRDLAHLYAVKTKHLNRQVRRNPGRFPEEFMFQLTPEERDGVVTNWRHLSPLKFSPQPSLADKAFADLHGDLDWLNGGFGSKMTLDKTYVFRYA